MVLNFLPVIRKVMKIKAEINMKAAEIRKGRKIASIGEIIATIPKIKVELVIIVPI